MTKNAVRGESPCRLARHDIVLCKWAALSQLEAVSLPRKKLASTVASHFLPCARLARLRILAQKHRGPMGRVPPSALGRETLVVTRELAR
eukprot:8560561-Pyramimonas_sp.AAC.1